MLKNLPLQTYTVAIKCIKTYVKDSQPKVRNLKDIHFTDLHINDIKHKDLNPKHKSSNELNHKDLNLKYVNPKGLSPIDLNHTGTHPRHLNPKESKPFKMETRQSVNHKDPDALKTYTLKMLCHKESNPFEWHQR